MHSCDTIEASFDFPLQGWTPDLRARFLAVLSEKGNVRHAAARCGLSAQSAYKLRRRDALFARGWAAALLLAREHAGQVMADRALDGIEEPIFYRGEQVGTRRRYDTRLLLAHMARLDAHVQEAEHSGAEEDADRFDELLAVIVGEPVPAELGSEADVLPRPRAHYAADARMDAELDQEEAFDDDEVEPLPEERDAAIAAAGDIAQVQAEALWDEWFGRACRRVDGLDPAPQDGVNSVNRLSASPQASALPSSRISAV